MIRQIAFSFYPKLDNARKKIKIKECGPSGNKSKAYFYIHKCVFYYEIVPEETKY